MDYAMSPVISQETARPYFEYSPVFPAEQAYTRMYTEVKSGDTATDHASATKEGKACGQSILGWVATGDASVAAAKAAGGVNQVASVDHTAKNILGIIGEWCTVVKGS